jgi:phage-related protein
MKVYPTSIATELHKLAADGSMLCLAEITGTTSLGVPYTLRIARNIEDVVWLGVTWSRFWFDPEVVDEATTGNVPELQVHANNIGGYLEALVIQYENLAGAKCTLYWVNSNCLDETEPVFSITLDVAKPICSRRVVSLKLVAQNPLLLKYPSWVFHGTVCQYKDKVGAYRGFRGVLCGYAGVDTTCARTLAACLAKGNVARFGAQLGLRGDAQDDDDVNG